MKHRAIGLVILLTALVAAVSGMAFAATGDTFSGLLLIGAALVLSAAGKKFLPHKKQ